MAKKRMRNQDEIGVEWQQTAMVNIEGKELSGQKKFMLKLMIIEEGYGVDVSYFRSKIPLKYDDDIAQEGV